MVTTFKNIKSKEDAFNRLKEIGAFPIKSAPIKIDDIIEKEIPKEEVKIVKTKKK